MKKIIALLCALLTAVSCACAESAPIVEFSGRLRLNGALPEGYRFTLVSQSDLALEGQIVSGDPSAPVLEVFIAFNESYAQVSSLQDLGDDTLEIVKQGFASENEVGFGSFDTASGDSFLMVREAAGAYLDFYTVCLGHEIELTLFPADGQTLTDAQAALWQECVRTMDIIPANS